MFIYRNHRFHIAGFSFEIPDGYVLDQMQTEEYQYGMKMMSPDSSIVLSVRPYSENIPGYVIKDARSMMADFLDDCDEIFHVIELMKPVSRCGKQGYCASYKLGNVLYHEEKYDIPANAYGIRILEIVVEARRGRTLEEVMAEPVVVRFLKELDFETGTRDA